MTYPQTATPLGKHAFWVGITLGWLAWPTPLAAQEPEPRFTLRGHTKEVQCVVISPDGTTLASGSADNTVQFWDVASGKEHAVVKAAEFWVDSVAFSPDGKTLASGGGGNKVQLWDVATRQGTTLYDKLSQ